jgi:hypothetical protein
MDCKEHLYRNLIETKPRDDANGMEFPSEEYRKIVAAIHKHDRTGHNGGPCPEPWPL